jgi:hemerythrin-like domain-containing protein
MSVAGNPYADTRAMYAVHTLFRRELALLPALVGSVPSHDRARAEVVADHVKLLCDMLHHHHSAEDAVLWPLLLARAPKEIDPVVQLAEGHHQALDDLLTEAGKRLETWRDSVAGEDSAALALTLRRLAVAAFEHMGLEERLVLPVVERHIFATEWAAMEEHALGAYSADEAVLLVGMVMYEEGIESIGATFPAEVLEAAPRVYAAYCDRVHGTQVPPRSTELAIGTPLVGVASEVMAG